MQDVEGFHLVVSCDPADGSTSVFVTSEPDEAASHRSRLDARTYVRHVEIAGPEAARDVGSTKFMRAAAPYVDSLIEDSLRDVRRRRWRQAQEETS